MKQTLHTGVLYAAMLGAMLGGCTGPRVSVKHLQMKIAASVEDYCGRHTVEYMDEAGCFVCYRFDDKDELKFMRFALSYFNKHYDKFAANAVAKSKEKMKEKDPFYNMDSVTLDGLVRTINEIPGGDKEMEHVMELYSTTTIGEKK